MSHDTDFSYSMYLPKKPAIGASLAHEPMRTGVCQCGASFETRSRVRKYCDACAAGAHLKSSKQSYLRRRAERERK
jgi:hypothetical protein